MTVCREWRVLSASIGVADCSAYFLFGVGFGSTGNLWWWWLAGCVAWVLVVVLGPTAVVLWRRLDHA